MRFQNVLEVVGKHTDLAVFRRQNEMRAIGPDGREVTLPLSFRALLPRPPALEKAIESDVGLLGYQALYGDWESLLNESWAIEAGIRNRETLIRHLEYKDPDHFYLAQRYRANEAKFGFRNWYAWNREMYGTSHDLGPETTVESTADLLTYRFLSFGGAPWAWFEKVKGAFPLLTMTLDSKQLTTRAA